MRVKVLSAMVVALTVTWMSSSAYAVAIAKFSLGTPTVQPGLAAVEVLLEFTSDDSADQIDLLALSVYGSDLTGGDTNFSRYSFSPGTAIADWDTLGDQLGVDGVETRLVISNGLPLNPGNYSLGTIQIDLSGLAAGSAYSLILRGGDNSVATDTNVAGTLLVGGISTPIFNFGEDEGANDIAFVEFGDDARYVVPQGGNVIPEPATAALGLLSLVGLAAASRRRR